jgi:beta-phosphoglucomutase family hydrolase
VAGARAAGTLNLPASVRGCLFDLDGVLTRTASAHEAAWTEMFNEYLATLEQPASRSFGHDDYIEYLDGKPRADGIRSFLGSRGVRLPEGSATDPPGCATVDGLGRRKNQLFQARLACGGIEVFDGSVRFVQAVRASGLRVAVVSSSANAAQVLAAAGIERLFDARVDGETARSRHLPGKPAPDMFLAGAAALGMPPGEAAVFEDALAGVEAGRAGNFALVVGVDRARQRDALLAHGADIVVDDLSELLLDA